MTTIGLIILFKVHSKAETVHCYYYTHGACGPDACTLSRKKRPPFYFLNNSVKN